MRGLGEIRPGAYKCEKRRGDEGMATASLKSSCVLNAFIVRRMCVISMFSVIVANNFHLERTSVPRKFDKNVIQHCILKLDTETSLSFKIPFSH